MSCCWFVSSFNCHFDKVKRKICRCKKMCYFVLEFSLKFLLWLLLISRLSEWSISYLFRCLFCALKNMVSISTLNITWAFPDTYWSSTVSFKICLRRERIFYSNHFKSGGSQNAFFLKIELRAQHGCLLSQTLIQVNGSTHSNTENSIRKLYV